MTKRTIQCYADAAIQRKATELAKRERRSVSSLIRELIEAEYDRVVVRAAPRDLPDQVRLNLIGN